MAAPARTPAISAWRGEGGCREERGGGRDGGRGEGRARGGSAPAGPAVAAGWRGGGVAPAAGGLGPATPRCRRRHHGELRLERERRVGGAVGGARSGPSDREI